MNRKVTITDVLELSVEERIRLMEEIWESITAHPECLELTEQQKTELDRRMAGFERDPDQVIPWEQVEAELRRR